MAVRQSHSNDDSVYFITVTCFRWLHLFELSKSYDCVYKWFDYLRVSKKAEIIGYVIMPNHFHLILNFVDESIDLNKLVGNGKRFIAYEIVKRLTQSGMTQLLFQLSNDLSDRQKEKGQKHRVFEESFDAKPIFTDKFLKQKLNYIHANPIRGKWALASDFVSYEHSSASFYELGVTGHFKPVHYKDIRE